jgi:hypothetical protein
MNVPNINLFFVVKQLPQNLAEVQQEIVSALFFQKSFERLPILSPPALVFVGVIIGQMLAKKLLITKY